MDWVHCNICAVQPGENNRKLLFRLTSCKHIFCQNCLKGDDIDECQLCKVKDVSTIQLSAQMKPEIKAYFEDPEDLLSQLTKTIEFQKGQRMRFIQLLTHKVDKYNRAKQYIYKIEQKLKQEMEMRRKLAKELQIALKDLEILRGSGGGSAQSSQHFASRQLNIEQSFLPRNSTNFELNRANAGYSQQSDMSPFSIISNPSRHDTYQRYREPPITKQSINMTPSTTAPQSPFTPVSNYPILGRREHSISSGRMPFGTTPTSQLNSLQIASTTPRVRHAREGSGLHLQ